MRGRDAHGRPQRGDHRAVPQVPRHLPRPRRVRAVAGPRNLLPRQRREPAGTDRRWRRKGQVATLAALIEFPADTASLPYFPVADITSAMRKVEDLGGQIVHPGERWAICRDSEGTPFALE